MIFVLLARTADAQILGVSQVIFATPLRITNVMLPLGHPPVDVACSLRPQMVEETRYWQKNANADGVFFLQTRPGKVPPPSCDKTGFIHPPYVVSCFLYSGFMVKEQYYEGDEGADGVAVIALQPKQAMPPCLAAKAPGEVSLASGDTFWGAAGGYIFLNGPEVNVLGESDFSIFQPSAPGAIVDAGMYDVPSSRLSLVPGGLNLRFHAEEAGNCSVWDQSAASQNCLARMTKAAGASISLADCLRTMSQSSSKPFPQDPVAIEYPAILAITGSSAKLHATGPAIACFASE